MWYEYLIIGLFVGLGLYEIYFTKIISRTVDSLYWRGSTFKKDLELVAAVVVPVTIVIIGIQAIISFLIPQNGNEYMAFAALSAPPFEELVKFVTIYILAISTAFSKRLFKKRWAYYGFLSGLAFGIFEYIVYVFGTLPDGVTEALVTAIIRITPIFMHAFLAVIDAYAVLLWLNGKKWKSFGVYLIAAATHFTYNTLALLTIKNEIFQYYALIFGMVFLVVMTIIATKIQMKKRLSYDDFMVPAPKFTTSKLTRKIFMFLLRPYDKVDTNKRVCPLKL